MVEEFAWSGFDSVRTACMILLLFKKIMARIRRALIVICYRRTHLDKIVIHTTLMLLLPKHLVDFVFSNRMLSAFFVHRDYC